MNGCVDKEQFEKTLRAHKKSVDEMQSGQRDKIRRALSGYSALNDSRKC